MKFSYTYRDSGGERHASEIEAPSRDAAFAILREVHGIKPIRLTAEAPDAAAGDAGAKSPAGGERHPPSAPGAWRLAAFAVLSAVLVVGAWLLLRRDAEADPVVQDDVSTKGEAAIPRPRHWLGARIPVESVFNDPTERYLATFAEPGREVREREEDYYEGAFAEAVLKPVFVSARDAPPVAEFKRILAGLKEEASLQLRGGKGVREVADWFVDRQKMESEWRNGLVARVEAGEVSAASANRMLQSMGFEPIPQK